MSIPMLGEVFKGISGIVGQYTEYRLNSKRLKKEIERVRQDGKITLRQIEAAEKTTMKTIEAQLQFHIERMENITQHFARDHEERMRAFDYKEYLVERITDCNLDADIRRRCEEELISTNAILMQSIENTNAHLGRISAPAFKLLTEGPADEDGQI